jgi:hypothetical protein
VAFRNEPGEVLQLVAIEVVELNAEALRQPLGDRRLARVGRAADPANVGQPRSKGRGVGDDSSLLARLASSYCSKPR